MEYEGKREKKKGRGWGDSEEKSGVSPRLLPRPRKSEDEIKKGRKGKQKVEVQISVTKERKKYSTSTVLDPSTRVGSKRREVQKTVIWISVRHLARKRVKRGL